LVQANFGAREELRIAGVPIGLEITDLKPQLHHDDKKDGSIIIVVATNAPLLPHQLQRVVKRAALGLGRVGSIARDSSGDIFIAFSTRGSEPKDGLEHWTSIPNEKLNALFSATASAVEEAIVNALVAAQTMKGINDNTVFAIPHDRLRTALRKYNRLS